MTPEERTTCAPVFVPLSAVILTASDPSGSEAVSEARDSRSSATRCGTDSVGRIPDGDSPRSQSTCLRLARAQPTIRFWTR